jgi:predicted amidohydrolase
MEKNLAKHLEFADKAIKEGSSLIVFPELSLTGYTLRDLVPEIAITPDSEILQPLMIKSAFLSICFGAVEISEDFFYYNSSFFMESGRTINITRKIYPPNYGVFEEKRFFAQGKQVRAFDSELGRFGVLICNDARHPALAYILALDGAKFLIIQSAIPARGFPKGEKPVPLQYFEDGHRLYASAFGVYVLFANLAGYEDGLLYSGNSMAFAPGGIKITEAPLFEEEMITVEISEEEIRKYRMASPIFGEEDINITLEELVRIKSHKSV